MTARQVFSIGYRYGVRLALGLGNNAPARFYARCAAAQDTDGNDRLFARASALARHQKEGEFYGHGVDELHHRITYLRV